ncbi:MAG: hypothetical protein GKR95_25250 [Gammaproteobacteria bacterium]|nr:hypothetical protein [Gammaproteobacteria bacterium]
MKIKGTTPIGLMATFGESGKYWETLTLANGAGGKSLEFSDVVNPLKAAMQTNQQFLVISNPQTLSNVFTSPEITIAGWTFSLDPGLWAKHDTLIIFKFFYGKSLKELTNDLSLWTSPNIFNKDEKKTQSLIKTIISDAICRYEPSKCTPPSTVASDAVYADFVGKVTDKNWNGILALNCSVPLTQLPSQIEGLAAGVNSSLFKAHHVGINLNPVHKAGCGELYMGPSSIFALIDYPPKGTTLPTSEFVVDSLQMHIENSLIKTFKSNIQLTIHEFFKEQVTISNAPTGMANTITLKGTYSSHDGHPDYTFSTTSKSLFTCTSAALDTIQVNSVQFVTLQKPLDPVGGEVKTRFIFDGILKFQAPTEFDLFSYDSLPFSNLFIDMDFDPSKPQDSGTFSFDPSQLALDIKQAVVRKDSLASQFPLLFMGMSQGTNKTLPKGYLSVGMPEDFAKTGDFWYRLTWSLPLGSMGALSPKKGFNATLITLTWSGQTHQSS